jgi:hypothetical protein
VAFTVTVSQGGAKDIGMQIQLRVYTGQAASPVGAVNSAKNSTPSLAITPAGASGSIIFGANLGLAGTYTANGATSYTADNSGAGLEFVAMRSASTVGSAGGAVTIGGTASASSLSICLMELLAAGTLTQDASTPVAVTSPSVEFMSTASFAPPAGSVLVLMVTTNGATGTVTISVSDTSGLSLPWTEQVSQPTQGYSGIWTTVMPGGSAPRLPQFMRRRVPVLSAGPSRATGAFSR